MTQKNIIILAVVLAIIIIAVWFLLVAGDDDEEENDEEQASTELTTLAVSGSGGTTAVLEAIKPAFEAAVPSVQIEVLPGTGTGGGVTGVVEGTLDVAAMSRTPKDEEKIEYAEFGRSGQALYVHEGVGNINLTSEQVKAILSGEITNWSEVGGPDLKLVLYVRDEGDASTAAFREAIFGDAAFPESAQVMTSQGDMINAVEGIEGAVGFGTWPAVMAEGANVKPISLDGVGPTESDYPIVGVLGLGYLVERQADVQPLIDWLLSEAGKTELRKIGVIVE